MIYTRCQCGPEKTLFRGQTALQNYRQGAGFARLRHLLGHFCRFLGRSSRTKRDERSPKEPRPKGETRTNDASLEGGAASRERDEGRRPGDRGEGSLYTYTLKNASAAVQPPASSRNSSTLDCALARPISHGVLPVSKRESDAARRPESGPIRSSLGILRSSLSAATLVSIRSTVERKEKK